MWSVERFAVSMSMSVSMFVSVWEGSPQLVMMRGKRSGGMGVNYAWRVREGRCVAGGVVGMVAAGIKAR